MSTVVIEKYVDGNRVEVLELPAAPILFLSKFLPIRAKQELLRQGLDVDSLLNDSAVPLDPQWMEIEEKKVARRIRILRRD